MIVRRRPARGTWIGHDRGLEQLGAGHRGQADPQIANAVRTAAMGVDAIRQDDHVASSRWIDPDRRAGEAEVADRPFREEGRDLPH